MRIHGGLSMLFVAAGFLFSGVGGAEEPAKLDFELKDQFKKVHNGSGFRGRIVVVVGSDRGGTKFSDAWSEAIESALGQHPRYDDIGWVALAVAGLVGALRELLDRTP
ncbi:MAG: hypothetical protein VYE73_15135 [Acidobacteriota bacterium]|nr:hypothetical protein [Acidobacteriota bacterium]